MDPSDSAAAGSNARDIGKKKRGNRHAKVKQTKVDARREQWLAKVKSKEGKEENLGAGCEVTVGARGKSVAMDVKNVEVEEKKGWNQQKVYWDSSPSNSSPGSFQSLLVSNSSGTGFSGSSVGSGGCWSGSITEEEDENDEYLDDWEAVADALGLGDKKIDPVPDPEPHICQDEPSGGLRNEANLFDKESRPENLKDPVSGGGCRAWKPDDAFRPQSLPNLTKQSSCPVNSDMHYERGGCGSWVHSNILSLPSLCPICYEDLDITDTSFLPCLCGFRLCLFCHKRILEEDGRCPGCRKPYEKNELVERKPILNGGTSPICFARSFSVVTGSRK